MGSIDMFKRYRVLLFIFLFLVAMPPGIVIAESEQEEHAEVHLRHRLELFLGNSHEDHKDGFSAGLAYEYRLNQILGIGGLVEYAGGDLRSGLVQFRYLSIRTKACAFFLPLAWCSRSMEPNFFSGLVWPTNLRSIDCRLHRSLTLIL